MTRFRAITECIVLYALYVKNDFDRDISTVRIIKIEQKNVFVSDVIDAFSKIQKLFYFLPWGRNSKRHACYPGQFNGLASGTLRTRFVTR